MPEFKNVTLTWTQLTQLEQYIVAIKVIAKCPYGELKTEGGHVCIEWDESEVKFSLPD